MKKYRKCPALHRLHTLSQSPDPQICLVGKVEMIYHRPRNAALGWMGGGEEGTGQGLLSVSAAEFRSIRHFQPPPKNGLVKLLLPICRPWPGKALGILPLS